jgi:hypothetical protein
MSETQAAAPAFSWDAPAVEGDEADDFLQNVDAQDVPLACSLENPDCEACQ